MYRMTHDDVRRQVATLMHQDRVATLEHAVSAAQAALNAAVATMSRPYSEFSTNEQLDREMTASTSLIQSIARSLDLMLTLGDFDDYEAFNQASSTSHLGPKA